jgi:hypothetical protein
MRHCLVRMVDLQLREDRLKTCFVSIGDEWSQQDHAGCFVEE